MVRRLVACVTGILGGCGDPCLVSLNSELTYAQAEAMARADAERYCSPVIDLHIEIGTCGDLRYVEQGDGFTGFTRYFSADGTFVAGMSYSDFPDENGCYVHIGGFEPECQEVTTEVLCPGRYPIVAGVQRATRRAMRDATSSSS